METIFINTENSKTNEPHRFKLNLTDKLNLKNPKKNMALANLSIYYTWKNIKSEYNISTPTWNETFNLPDGSYSILDIQDYFEFIIRKHETLTENLSIQIFPNKVINRIVFKIKTGYKLKLLSPETMELFESTNRVVDKDKNGKDVPKLEPVEVKIKINTLWFSKKWLSAYIQSIIYFCARQKICTITKYFSTCFYNDEYSKYRIFFCWSLVYGSS